MKLTQQEIKFIDNYLIKNKVKFWDVRLELLDHIVSAVEEKTETEGISFNEALLEVHRSFGNQIHNGYTYDLDFNKVLYVDNKGFKKFQLKQQRQISKKQFRTYWRTFLPFVTSLRFLCELLLVVMVTFALYEYFTYKVAWLFLIGLIIILQFGKSFFSIFKKFHKYSMNLTFASTSLIFYTQVPFWGNIIFKWYFEDVAEKPYYLLILFCLGIYIFSRHSYNNYRRIHNTYKKRYDLLMS